MKKRFIAILLSLSMLLSLVPASALATESVPDPTPTEDEEPEITISADTTRTVTVKEAEPEPDPGPDPGPIVSGSLQFSALTHTIQRDYEQNCAITVRNTTSSPKEFYLEVNNGYDDLSMEIIQSGSKSSPAIIAAGESLQVTLTVFAQNAEREQYTVPITAYVFTDGEYEENAKNNVTLNCELPYLNLTWTQISSNDSTLRQTWRVTNNRDTLTDLSIAASDSLKDYLTFSPIISNYELVSGASVEFEVRPDLAKMKSGSVTELSGSFVASCAGKTSEQECVFDTQGQEITITTMGELALKQDGNPFSNYEIDEDSIIYTYDSEDGQEIEINDNTDFESTIKDDGTFNIQSSTLVDVGARQPVKVTTSFTTFTLDASSDKEILDTEIVELDDGSVQVKVRIAISGSDYKKMLLDALENSQEASASNAVLLEVDPETIDEYAEYGTDIVTTYWDLIDTYEEVKDTSVHILPPGAGHAVSVLGYVHDAYSVYNDTRETINVFSDPRLSDDVKQTYLSCHLYKLLCTSAGYYASIVLAPVCPIGALLMGGLTYLASQAMDGVQEGFIDAAYSALYSDIEGHQCTNRGRITVPFYVPNYDTSGGSKPQMRTTGRMHGDGYVDKTDTNYDITLNGEPVGTTNNTGLTDVTMADIPTDNLKPGETNVIDFDYDTNPGSHSVSTDTQITLLYPNDTEIGYIGEPDDLQDVRTKPDFCVYPENIFSSTDSIVGEPAQLRFNVYNRGSRGGWFNVTGYDENSTVLFTEENYYLAAFSSHTFEVDWTPSKTSTQIRIELVNTSVDLEERYSNNNTATTTVTAREREVPEILPLNSGTVYENTPFSVTVNINNARDLETATFTLDGTTVPSDTRSSGTGSNRRYLLTFDDGLPAGEHSIKVVASYKTAGGTATTEETLSLIIQERTWIVPAISAYVNTLAFGEELDFSVRNIQNLLRVEFSVGTGTGVTVEPYHEDEWQEENENWYFVDMSSYGTGEIQYLIKAYYRTRAGGEDVVERSGTVTIMSPEDSYFTLTLSDSIISPEFYIYGYSYEYDWMEFEKTGDNTYRLQKISDMFDSPEDYTVIISYASGVIVTNMSENAQTISEAGCHCLIVQKTEKDRITSAAITRIHDAGYSGLTVDIPVSLDSPLFLTPGQYILELEGSLDGVSFGSRTVEVDVSNGDQEIPLSQFALLYYFSISDPDPEGYDVTLYYRDQGDTYWSTGRLSQQFDENTNILKCYSSSSWTVSAVEDSDEAYVLIHSDTEIYFVQVKETVQDLPALMAVEEESDSGVIQLDKSSLNQVSFVSEHEEWRVGSVNVQWNRLTVNLHGDTLYIPDGDYNFSVVLSSGYRTLVSSIEASVTDDCELSVDQDLSSFRDVTISWPLPFSSSGTVQYATEAGNNMIERDFVSGNTFKAEDGDRTFQLELSYKEDTFRIIGRLSVSEENNQLTIGDRFTANISSYFRSEYDMGDTVSLSITNARDSSDNSLESLYATNMPLRGQVTYTNVDDESKSFSVPVTATSLSGIDAALPGEPGTYSISLELTTKGAAAIHTVSIDGSYATSSGAGDYAEGGTVSINAGTRTDYLFVGWTSSDVEVAEPNNASTTFTMPAKDVLLTANWRSSINPSYTVTFNSQGGSSVDSQTVESGQTVSRPTNPTRPNYSFDDWYTSTGYTQIYDFDTPVTGNITLYARWSYAGGGGGGGGGSSTSSSYAVSTPSNLTGGSISVSPTNARRGDRVTVTVRPNEGYTLGELTVKDSGGTAISTNSIGNNQYTFTMPNSRVSVEASFVAVNEPPPPPEPTTSEIIFSDIEPGRYYYDAVQWAVQNGITNGRTPTTFEPGTACTRAHAVTFLWRAAGSPIPTSSYNPFLDVSPDTYYYDAVLWAVQNGITNGKTATTFEPYSVCNRGQIVTFLYRSTQVTNTSSDNPFVDVARDAYYYDAVNWAADTGVTLGTTATTFSPAQDCNRGQIVTFLYRHFVK